MNDDLEKRTKQYLEEIESKGLRRSLQTPHGIDLSSNDYLKLSAHPRIKEAMIKAIEEEGCGATASRLLRGERECFAAIEKRFAAFKQTESSLFFGSGYAANLGLLATFLEEGDVVFSDELNHASLIDGIRLSKSKRVIFKHANVNDLKKLIDETPCEGQRFLVTESLFSMDGDIAPLDEYADLCRETSTALIVDDAHAVGIYGETGSGLVEEFGIEDNVFLSMNGCGKALGASGAFVCGADWAIDYMIQRARSFIFSTAPPPSVAAAIDAALDVIKEEPERRLRLFHLSKFLRDALGENGLDVADSTSQIISVIIGESEKAVAYSKRLQEAGFDVRAIRPPTVPVNTARLRVSLNIDLNEETLTSFSTLMKSIW